MYDREKVIKGLRHCTAWDGLHECQPKFETDCPYEDEADCMLALMRDALFALLKEQEPKPDKCIICENCGHKLQDDWNWCPWCRLETARGRQAKLNGF